MRVIITICLLGILSCNKSKKSPLLQSNIIRLAQPRVIASNTLIDSFVTVHANLKLDDVVIYYTLNGKEPDTSSSIYSTPIKAYNPGTYKFKAFHPDWAPSETAILKLLPKGIDVDTIIMHSIPHEKYSGLENNTLINLKKGQLNFSDKQWLGYDTVAKATLVLKEKKYIKSLTISYLNDVGSWIFPPSTISVSINGDLNSKKTIDIEQPKAATSIKTNTITIPIELQAESLLVEINNLESIPEWHEGVGQKAWLFTDEWILNE